MVRVEISEEVAEKRRISARIQVDIIVRSALATSNTTQESTFQGRHPILEWSFYMGRALIFREYHSLFLTLGRYEE